jgi:Stress responsive A/B Barrel Domain
MNLNRHSTRAWLAPLLLGVALFASGYAAGQRKLGLPHTIIHVVTIKWQSGVTEAQQQKALQGVKEVALKTPGVKNVWLKGERIQPRDFGSAFAIEFENRAAADRYAESPLHEAWEKQYVPLREASLSVQVTNP